MLGFFNAKVRFAYVGIPRIKRTSSYQVKTERPSNIAYDFLDKLEIRCSMQRYSSEQALYFPFAMNMLAFSEKWSIVGI